MKKKEDGIFGRGVEIILGISVLLAFILPHTSTLFLLVNPLLCVILFFIKRDKHIARFCWFPVFAILIALLTNIAGDASQKALFAAVANILYLLSFPFVCGYRVKNIYLYSTFALIFLSQVSYMFQITPVVAFVDKYYPIVWNERGITHMIDTIDTTNYTSFRLGGIYRNPNQCAKYVSLLLAVFLINNKNKSVISQFWFLILCFFSVLLTGSRTGLVVVSLLIIIALYTSKTKNKWVIAFFVAVFIGFIIYGVFVGSTFRGFDIENGLDNSLGVKWRITMSYISTEPSVMKLLLGHLDMDLFETNTTYSLDCEYGYIIYCYGFLGVFALLTFYIQLFRKIDKDSRLYFCVLLWMLSSSIMMAYRSSFIFFLLLSTVYKNTTKCPESDIKSA